MKTSLTPCRWSLNRRQGYSIPYEDFKKMIEAFKVQLTRMWDCDSEATVSFYNDIPTSLTTISGSDEEVHEKNEKMLSMERPLETIIEADFQRAKYIVARIYPTEKGRAAPSAFGSVSFKGFKPQSAIFFAQPKKSVKKASIAVKMRFGFAFWKWRIGDGYEENHHIEIPVM